MSVAVNGIAHIQMTVNNIEACMPFWEKLCHFLEMKTLIKNETTLYCIGSRTGILIREAPQDKKHVAFDQDTSGLHHFCFRVRAREDIDAIYAFIESELDASFIHGPEAGDHFAPGYYSILFEDPDGIRVEFNYVPGRGHFGDEGRLGPAGEGPSDTYGEKGI
ncbi:MAG: VOC family protein [Gammaproteobacteria bacterium]|jgi:catechol 2,3-dioxygenase-like lactoylglutathione lyase family enzyme|nr:VOC family protein [Gammaproteobacteria bacterium]MBT4493076.1 VOC family protein [Gammaproteobacteria bacterium]